MLIGRRARGHLAGPQFSDYDAGLFLWPELRARADVWEAGARARAARAEDSARRADERERGG